MHFICGESASTSAFAKPSAKSARRARRAARASASGSRRKRAPLVLGCRRVLLRHDPLRRALEQRELRDAVGERATVICTARRAGADDADAPAVERHGVVPARAVEAAPAKSSSPSMSGSVRVVQHAGRGDDDVDLVAVAAVGLEVASGRRRSARRAHLVAEADALEHAVLRRDALEVGLDLGARREAGGSSPGSARTSSCRGATGRRRRCPG